MELLRTRKRPIFDADLFQLSQQQGRLWGWLVDTSGLPLSNVSLSGQAAANVLDGAQSVEVSAVEDAGGQEVEAPPEQAQQVEAPPDNVQAVEVAEEKQDVADEVPVNAPKVQGNLSKMGVNLAAQLQSKAKQLNPTGEEATHPPPPPPVQQQQPPPPTQPKPAGNLGKMGGNLAQQLASQKKNLGKSEPKAHKVNQGGAKKSHLDAIKKGTKLKNTSKPHPQQKMKGQPTPMDTNAFMKSNPKFKSMAMTMNAQESDDDDDYDAAEWD